MVVESRAQQPRMRNANRCPGQAPSYANLQTFQSPNPQQSSSLGLCVLSLFLSHSAHITKAIAIGLDN